MVVDWSKTDALIFDMDGTLWDAVDSYCEVWNACFRSFGVERVVERKELEACMGLSLAEIYQWVAKGEPVIAPDVFLPALTKLEDSMMPQLGGVPFPMVREGIGMLSEKYRIFLLSNCGVNGLRGMMRHVGISSFVTEAVTYGDTQRQKSDNMLVLKEKYGLCRPVYIGDTESDCFQTRRAGFPFVFAAYGFGNCIDPDLSFASFAELVEFFLKLKEI